MNNAKFIKTFVASAAMSCAAFAAFGSTARAAELTIEVSNITELKGQVMVALYANGETWLGKAAHGSGAAATAEKVLVKFADVPAGTYAAAVFQDVLPQTRRQYWSEALKYSVSSVVRRNGKMKIWLARL